MANISNSNRATIIELTSRILKDIFRFSQCIENRNPLHFYDYMLAALKDGRTGWLEEIRDGNLKEEIPDKLSFQNKLLD